MPSQEVMLIDAQIVLIVRATSIPCTRIFMPHRGIRHLVWNLLLAAENAELPVFATFISNSRFFGLLFSFTVYKTIKSSHCKLWFCAVAPSSKLDTR